MSKALDGVTGKVDELKNTTNGLTAKPGTVKDAATSKVEDLKDAAGGIHAPDAPAHDEISPAGVGSVVESHTPHHEG